MEISITPSKHLDSVAPGTIKIIAMVDTGAECTVVKPEVIRQLGIEPIDVIQIATPAHPPILCYQFSAQLWFPGYSEGDYLGVSSEEIIEAPLEGLPIQCLIGRDILKHGLFIYNGEDQSFTLSF